MGRIPEETIQTIRDRIDIVAVIGRYVDLKKSGRNFKGRCPFHEEKTPSFNVNPDRQIFHCFGCQVGGNAMSFLMRYENLSFPEAVRTLGKECGVEVPDNDSGDRGVSEQLFAANEHAQDFYQRGLEPAKAASAPRRTSPSAASTPKPSRPLASAMRPTAGMNWEATRALRGDRSPGDRRGLARRARFKGRAQAQGSAKGSYARLRGRVVFPIRDVRDRIVGFGGRAIFPDQEPKYLNTPESPIFHKRDALYGFPQALEAIRKQRTCDRM